MRTRNFRDEEFVCRCRHCNLSIPQPGLVVPELMIALQQARDILQAPITVTSGRRCVRHNRKVGGVRNSYHCSGRAVDVKADNMDGLYDALIAVPTFRYIERHEGYIHADVGMVRTVRFVDKRGEAR